MTMRRSAVACLSLLVVAACAQTAPGVSQAPEQAVTVPGPVPGASRQVMVSGEMQTTRLPAGATTVPRHDLIVRVNGQPAVAGSLVTYGATTLEGSSGTMPVNAVCQSRELGRADRQFDCLVTLNHQQSVPMSFRATPTGPQPPVGQG
jgi:hypothetical protein